ncbi:MAG: hypothetical protein ACFFD4_21995 [Candidatus Odinarchaeota archaeon]
MSSSSYRVHSGSYGLHLGKYSSSTWKYYPAHVEQAIYYQVDSLASSAITFWMRAYDTRVRTTIMYGDGTVFTKTFARTYGSWTQYTVYRSELAAGKTITELRFDG